MTKHTTPQKQVLEQKRKEKLNTRMKESVSVLLHISEYEESLRLELTLVTRSEWRMMARTKKR